MSEVYQREVRHVFVEVCVPNPTVWSEISKAISCVERAAKEVGIDTSYDDAVQVRADEDEIVFWFEKPKTV